MRSELQYAIHNCGNVQADDLILMIRGSRVP